jgi:hypothetical protein
MKFLAIERSAPAASADRTRELLVPEARRAWELHVSGVLREIYFTDQHDAVLVLECPNREEALSVLNTLPLMRERQIVFELLPLLPYTGFERLYE